MDMTVQVGPGRPDTYDEEKMFEVFDHIGTTDMPLKKVFLAVGIPERTFYRHLSKHPELWQNYIRMREVQQEVFGEKLLELAFEELPPGDMAAVQQQKLKIETLKWFMAKNAVKRYGDKVTQEHTGEVKHEHTAKMDDDQFAKALEAFKKDGPTVIASNVEAEDIDHEDVNEDI